MKDFPMVHPNVFSSNPLIQKIAGEKNWTVSDINKKPIHAELFLSTGELKGAFFSDGNPLVELSRLDADPNLQAVNRAYRLHARDNRVIAIDVEPSAPDAMKEQLLEFPAHYTELSMRGGVHLLIEIPDDWIPQEAMYLFEGVSVFKEPVPKGENREAHYEVIFNDHYITFTKKMDTLKPPADLYRDLEARHRIENFLRNIALLDEDKKAQREAAKQHRIQLQQALLEPETKKKIDEFLALSALDVAREEACAKTIEDYGGDSSRYEMAVASTLAFHTKKTHTMAKDTQSFRSLALSMKDQDLVHAIYIMMQDIVPYRDKHDEDREGLPWLLYTAKKAYEYVKSQKNQKKK